MTERQVYHTYVKNIAAEREFRITNNRGVLKKLMVVQPVKNCPPP